MFLTEPPATDSAAALYESDRDDNGYVMNLTHAWAWRPDVHDAFFAARALAAHESSLTDADRAAVHAATAAARDDSYCGLAWGTKLAKATDPATAAEVMRGGTPGDPRVAALAAWARKVALDPGTTEPADIDALRAVGLDDRAIFEATFLAAWRLAFTAVNSSLGARPDLQLAAGTPEPVRDAVSYGRAPAEVASSGA